MLLKVTRDGLLNLRTNESVAPSCNCEPADIGVTYGRPSGLSAALLASVTPAGKPLMATSIGARTGAPEVFLRLDGRIERVGRSIEDKPGSGNRELARQVLRQCLRGGSE